MTVPTFDVAITTYKRPDFAVAAVKSCLSQGQLLNNVIIVDDASHDDTGKRISELMDDRIIYYLRNQNGGIGAARRDSFNLSQAGWTIMLDSDHELLPGTIGAFACMAQTADPEIGILGARFRWDDGHISPVTVPSEPIDYAGRIRWCNRPDGIGADHLFCVARWVRDKVKWPIFRGGMMDTLFHLDIAKEAKALFTGECLALQKSVAPEGHTRGLAMDRFARRMLDAKDVVKTTELILDRHCNALKAHGLWFYGGILQTGAYYAFLSGQRKKCLKWLAESIRAKGLNIEALGILVGVIWGKDIFRLLYRMRG